MVFECNRCGQNMRKFGVQYGLALDFESGQPDDPAQADHDRGHLCLPCRAEFREWVDGASNEG